MRWLTICLRITIGGNTRHICFRIPFIEFYLPPIIKLPPGAGPDPIPWLESEKLISPKIQRDLQLVATLNAVAGELSEDLRKPVQATIEDAVKTLQETLPDEMSLKFQEL